MCFCPSYYAGFFLCLPLLRSGVTLHRTRLTMYTASIDSKVRSSSSRDGSARCTAHQAALVSAQNHSPDVPGLCWWRCSTADPSQGRDQSHPTPSMEPRISREHTDSSGVPQLRLLSCSQLSHRQGLPDTDTHKHEAPKHPNFYWHRNSRKGSESHQQFRDCATDVSAQ